jgi:hypothetical protein
MVSHRRGIRPAWSLHREMLSVRPRRRGPRQFVHGGRRVSAESFFHGARPVAVARSRIMKPARGLLDGGQSQGLMVGVAHESREDSA